MHIKTDDTVEVLSGRDKGKRGKVMSADPKAGMVLVEGVNSAKRHKKPRKQGDAGGIITINTPIRACKVMRVCPKCDKPTKEAHGFADGEKVRVCKKCSAHI